MTERRASMADVGAAAGVSAQTVSRVLNGSPRVDPETRSRVEAAMAELGYRPHRAARALRTGRTHTIGLIVSTLATVGNFRMLQAVTDAAAARGYAVTVVTLAAARTAIGRPGDVAAAVATAFERLHDQGVDGAIVLNEATASVRDSGGPPGLALVVVDSPADDRFGIVQSDHVGGARAAVAHLLDMGHATVHHLAGPSGSFAARERERGWLEALAEKGITAPEVIRGDWSAASGHRASGALAGATAVFVANDQMALGLLRALAESDRAVPENISVVGFDDVADAADYQPPLTTIRQDFDQLGEHAVAALVSAIEGHAVSGVDAVPTSLVIRRSAAAPRLAEV